MWTIVIANIPLSRIARLAVDKSIQRASLGRHLVDIALGMDRREVCPSVGCRFVVVESKKRAVKFYEKCGFMPPIRVGKPLGAIEQRVFETCQL